MNKYIKPEINIEKFEISDIITESNGDSTYTLEKWGSTQQTVNAEDVVDIYK